MAKHEYKFTNEQLDTIIKLVEREEKKVEKARDLLDNTINPAEQFALHRLHQHYDFIGEIAKYIKEQQQGDEYCEIVDFKG